MQLLKLFLATSHASQFLEHNSTLLLGGIVRGGETLGILEVQVEPVLVKESQNLYVLVGAKADGVDHEVCGTLACLVLPTCVKLYGLLILKEHPEDHHVVLNNGMHDRVPAIGISDVKLGTELKKPDQVVPHDLPQRVLPQEVD